MTDTEPTGWQHRRVTFLLLTADGTQTQLAVGRVMVRIAHVQKGTPTIYEAPIAASWDNYKHMFPGLFDDVLLMGMLIAELEGEWAGHIDWVRPLGHMQQEAELARQEEREPESIGMIVDTPARSVN